MNTITTRKFTVEEIAKALTEAKAAAEALKYTEDGGTCNFDSAIIYLSRELKFAEVEASAKAAGVSVRAGKWMGSKVAFVGLGEGQGQRRTSMAEAACKALKEHGLDASMYYQMD